MSELKHILQWVTISSRKDEPVVMHQFDEEGNQINIQYLLDLSDDDLLDVMIAIPVDQRIGKEKPVGNPFIAIDMRTGLMNINGTNWDFMPHGIDKTEIKFRPIWYHSVKQDYDSQMNLMEKNINLYKIGWQFTYNNKNYQRIIFFETETGIFRLKEKR